MVLLYGRYFGSINAETPAEYQAMRTVNANPPVSRIGANILKQAHVKQIYIFSTLYVVSMLFR